MDNNLVCKLKTNSPELLDLVLEASVLSVFFGGIIPDNNLLNLGMAVYQSYLNTYTGREYYG